MSFNHSYQNDYFSLIDIAATEERISCTTEQDLPKLGFLDTASDTEDLKAGTKVELPFWVAEKLIINNRRNAPQLFSCQIPKVYKENYRDILVADSSIVTLSKWNPYYYEFGMHLTKLPTIERPVILHSLLQTFKNRFQSIMDQAHNQKSDCMIGFQLPALERDLYVTGKKFYRELVNWIEKGSKKIETADIITNINLQKRKRLELDLD